MRYVLVLLTLCLTGCFGPDYAKVADRLRDQNLKLEQDLTKTRHELADREATIANLRRNVPTMPTLPANRLAELFTVDRIEIRGTTDAWDLGQPGVLNGFRVFVRPLTSDGTVLPAGGTITVEAFDLALKEGSQRIGTWTFGPAELKKSWYGLLGLNQFALNCPWQTPPAHDQITFRVQFVDALTGRTFVDQKLIRVHLKGARTRPAG